MMAVTHPKPVDPWGTPYQYRVLDSNVMITSAGPDRQFETEDDISSLVSWAWRESKEPSTNLVLRGIAVDNVPIDQSWNLKAPAATNSPWERLVPIVVFSNTPLTEALAEPEHCANSNATPGIRLCVSESTTGSARDRDSARVTFRAEKIRLKDALRIIGDLTDWRPVYGRNEAVLAPEGHADGSTSITETNLQYNLDLEMDK